MKKLIIFFGFIAILASCNNDFNGTLPVASGIDVTGKWSIAARFDTLFGEILPYPILTKDSVLFNSDMTFIIKTAGTTATGTYIANGKTIQAFIGNTTTTTDTKVFDFIELTNNGAIAEIWLKSKPDLKYKYILLKN